jgi:hypothetical protein
VMREREWSNLYIRGKTPGEAAQQAETYHWNMHRPLARLRRK